MTQLEVAMGRTRQEMRDACKACQDTVQEHIWKLVAYHKDRPKDVNGWTRSVNKPLPKLVLLNVKKGGKKTDVNMKRPELEDLFVTELFEEGDLEALNSNWTNEGFPIVVVTMDMVNKCQHLGKRFVECVLAKTQFRVTIQDL